MREVLLTMREGIPAHAMATVLTGLSTIFEVLAIESGSADDAADGLTVSEVYSGSVVYRLKCNIDSIADKLITVFNCILSKEYRQIDIATRTHSAHINAQFEKLEIMNKQLALMNRAEEFSSKLIEKGYPIEKVYDFTKQMMINIESVSSIQDKFNAVTKIEILK